MINLDQSDSYCDEEPRVETRRGDKGRQYTIYRKNGENVDLFVLADDLLRCSLLIQFAVSFADHDVPVIISPCRSSAPWRP